jgi:Cdc6-like AAA superfamily ATPase
MTFNFANLGKTVATIKGGKMNNKLVYLNGNDDDGEQDDDYVKTFTKIELPQTSKFVQVPNSDANRDVAYIVGPSGSGKTTYTSSYVKEIQRKNKDYPVIVFSTLTDDYMDIKNLKRVKLDDSLLTDPLTAEELQNSICIFDDVDCLPDKKIRAAVFTILKSVLEIGRHWSIYVLMTNHLATNGPDTRPILNEAHTVTFFPQAGTGRGLTYLLQTYCGLNTKDIEFIKTKKSRWCTFYKQYPQCLMFEREILTLDEITKQAQEYFKSKK